jgi:hypothetical protein
MKTSDVLIEARASIECSEKWCKLEMVSRDGVAHCAVGAVGKFYGVDVRTAPYQRLNNPAVDALSEAISSDEEALILLRVGHCFVEAEDCGLALWRVVCFNDEMSHKQVLSLFDRAIARALRVEALPGTAKDRDSQMRAEGAATDGAVATRPTAGHEPNQSLWLGGGSALANLESVV